MQGGGSPGTGPYPSLVLYDKDGNAADAVVYVSAHGPYLGPRLNSLNEGDEVTPGEWASDGVYLRVGLAAIGGKGVPAEAKLRLESGTIVGDLMREAYYLKSDCTGQKYGGTWVRLYGGRNGKPLLWPQGEVQKVDGSAYRKNYNGNCEEKTPDKLVPLTPASDWIKNAFPNPPYTLKPAY